MACESKCGLQCYSVLLSLSTRTFQLFCTCSCFDGCTHKISSGLKRKHAECEDDECYFTSEADLCISLFRTCITKLHSKQPLGKRGRPRSQSLHRSVLVFNMLQSLQADVVPHCFTMSINGMVSSNSEATSASFQPWYEYRDMPVDCLAEDCTVESSEEYLDSSAEFPDTSTTSDIWRLPSCALSSQPQLPDFDSSIMTSNSPKINSYYSLFELQQPLGAETSQNTYCLSEDTLDSDLSMFDRECLTHVSEPSTENNYTSAFLDNLSWDSCCCYHVDLLDNDLDYLMDILEDC